jgi:hypothetical protein
LTVIVASHGHAWRAGFRVLERSWEAALLCTHNCNINMRKVSFSCVQGYVAWRRYNLSCGFESQTLRVHIRYCRHAANQIVQSTLTTSNTNKNQAWLMPVVEKKIHQKIPEVFYEYGVPRPHDTDSTRIPDQVAGILGRPTYNTSIEYAMTISKYVEQGCADD